MCVCVIELVDLEMRTACFLDFEILHLFFFFSFADFRNLIQGGTDAFLEEFNE